MHNYHKKSRNRCTRFKTLKCKRNINYLDVVKCFFFLLFVHFDHGLLHLMYTRKPVDPLHQFINVEICLIYMQFVFASLVDPFRHSHPDLRCKGQGHISCLVFDRLPTSLITATHQLSRNNSYSFHRK